MIALARRLDALARAVRKDHESRVQGALARNGELLFQAAVAVHGTSGYPDGTLTLRLSYGTVAGWTESGKQVPAMTHLSGLYARNTGQYPFAVAPTWVAARPKLDPEMPFDLTTANDIIGGNSGSPLIDRNGQLVGAHLRREPGLAGRRLRIRRGGEPGGGASRDRDPRGPGEGLRRGSADEGDPGPLSAVGSLLVQWPQVHRSGRTRPRT